MTELLHDKSRAVCTYADIQDRNFSRQEEAFRRGYFYAVQDMMEAFATGMIARQLSQYYNGPLWDWRFSNDFTEIIEPPELPEPWKNISKRVLKRDKYICHYCGKKANTTDHIVPVAKGGTDNEDNLVAACSVCNSKKHTTDYNDFMRRVRWSHV